MSSVPDNCLLLDKSRDADMLMAIAQHKPNARLRQHWFNQSVWEFDTPASLTMFLLKWNDGRSNN